MSRRRRSVEVFSLSFLDCICCGFGAIILLLVLTEVGRPAVLEKSRKNLDGQLRDLTWKLHTIQGETTELTRQLQGSRASLEQEKQKLARLAGELSALQGEYNSSTHDASVSNRVEGELVTAYQKLSSEMERLLKQRARRPATEAIGGIPIDSEYIIFVVDTSDSMVDNHWDENLAIIDEILSAYPHVSGLQVMNDQGSYMFDGTKGQWLEDSPQERAEIRKRARHWAAFSQSNPVPGIEEALRTYWAADKRVSVFVLGDEFTGKSIQAALDAINALNKPGADGRRSMRIHAIGFPEGPDMSPDTNIRFSALMRLVCEQNNGTFVGLKN
ncbi:MAG TPA: hypothetical protein VHB68_15445 [Steroidobacteraceae bacterium]|nr:hypothetical protein [Steroidobacteraceae bacterium]